MQYVLFGVWYFFIEVILLYYYQRIKDLREDKELKQFEIAKILGTTQQQYSRYELGIQELPAHHAITLAAIYETSLDYIYGLTNEKSQYPKKQG